MKAPDKIFITEYNASVRTGYFSHDKDDMFNQEYIHKDALIEWANGMLKASASIYEETAYEELIEFIKTL